MEYKDLIWLSYRDLSEKKVRTALTVLMVVIGIASIIALISLTEGISASIQSSLSSLGPTSIIVTSTKATGFTLADTAEISALPNASTVIPILTGTATVSTNNENTSATIIGISPQDLQTVLGGNLSIYQGSVYSDTVSPTALFGYSLAFPSSTDGRQNIFVGTPVTATIASGRTSQKTTIPVGGILQSYGTLIVPVDTGVIMSMPAAQSLLHKTSFNEILVKANNASGVTPLSNLITQIYGSNARVLNTQQLAATASSIIGAITLLLVVIAGISLLVAAIGIMNVMLMSVMERTHEIGIMKSIGFKSSEVMTIFLFQALLIGFIGGVIGIFVGAGAAFGLSALSSAHPANTTATPAASTPTSSGTTFRAGGGAGGGGGGGTFVAGGGAPASTSSSSSSLSFTPTLTIPTILIALFVAMFVSGIAGLYPAWRASKMQPIDALRTL